MNYSSLLGRLFNINFTTGMKQGLANCKHLQELLHFPDREYQNIHVAGTNGKGSVSLKMASALQSAGYRVGLYTSPHISSFRERIRVNGQMIEEKEVENILTSLFNLIDSQEIPATFFELATFLAFLYFRDQKVDIAVFETGLGGRLDATNIISPCLAIITSISLDHTEILGDSEEAIAKEKAGIMKPGIPVIIGPNTPQDYFKKVAHQYNCPYIAIDKRNVPFEEENKAIARAALYFLTSTLQLNDTAIETGLNARLPCRLEVAKQEPLVILDVAHNPDGLAHLFSALRIKYPGALFRILFGLSKTKDLQGCIHLIQQNGRHFHLVEAENGRGAPLSVLQNLMEEMKERTTAHSSIFQGVAEALQGAKEQGEILVICGTFFIMSAARQALGIIEPSDAMDMNER